MSLSNTQYHYYIDPVDLTCSDTYELALTSESDVYFYPMIPQISITAKSGTILTPAICSIGTNSPDYNNIVPATAIGGVQDDLVNLSLSSSLKKVPYNTSIKLKVAAATGISLVLEAKPILLGIYN